VTICSSRGDNPGVGCVHIVTARGDNPGDQTLELFVGLTGLLAPFLDLVDVGLRERNSIWYLQLEPPCPRHHVRGKQALNCHRAR
jgi:predicted small integral membrane protein